MFYLWFILILAIIFDIVWGELPTFIHPVVWMGKAIDQLSSLLINWNSKLSGLVLTISIIFIFLVIFSLILYLVSFSPIFFIIISALLLSSSFAIKGLYRTANEVQIVLEENVDDARLLVSYLVSRSTKNLLKSELASATIESMTENINDSVIAPFFYIMTTGVVVTSFINLDFVSQVLILPSTGLTGLIEFHTPLHTPWFAFTLIILPILVAMVYRVINTLDAMVGYKNSKYEMIGWFPARLDDIVNFLPSRITGIMVVIAAGICGMEWKNSWMIMKRDAKNTPSPNSGFPMAAAAGALKVKLEKPGIYAVGESENLLDSKIIGKAIFLTKITIFIFVAICFILHIFLSCV